MTQDTLEKRVTRLEQQMAQLLANSPATLPAKDWRRTIGMFAGDEIMKKIFEEGRKIREADRLRARRRYAKPKRGES